MVLKITSVLAFYRKRVQARCKDSVKVTVKFIRRGIFFQQTKDYLCSENNRSGGRQRERDISCSPWRKWEQKLKMVVLISQLYTGQLVEYTW
jgi:hypothetical protein